MTDELYEEARATEPKRPICDREIEVTVVGRRCVYINNHRIAGGKPYISLPSYSLNTRLRDVLDAFSEEDILAALKEQRAWKEHWRLYRARSTAAELEARARAVEGDSDNPLRVAAANHLYDEAAELRSRTGEKA